MASAALKQDDPQPVDTPAVDNSDEAPPERDYEAEARERGWVPQDEFLAKPNADAKRWVDAQTFVDRTDTVMPLLKADRDRLKREIADLKRDFRKASEHFSKAEERGYERALADLKARQEQAVEAGDVAAHREISKEIDKLRKDIPSTTPIATKEEAQQAWEDWRDANPWYDRGLKVAAASEVEQQAALYADRMTQKHIARAEPGPNQLPPTEFFAMIKELVAEKYPLIDAKPARQKPPSDVAGTTNGRGKSGGKSWADIEAQDGPEQRRMAERTAEKWAKSGLLKNKDDYLKSYPWSKA